VGPGKREGRLRRVSEVGEKYGGGEELRSGREKRRKGKKKK